MTVNDSKSVKKKKTILNKTNKNYDLFEHQNKIRTYLTKHN